MSQPEIPNPLDRDGDGVTTQSEMNFADQVALTKLEGDFAKWLRDARMTVAVGGEVQPAPVYVQPSLSAAAA